MKICFEGIFYIIVYFRSLYFFSNEDFAVWTGLPGLLIKARMERPPGNQW